MFSVSWFQYLIQVGAVLELWEFRFLLFPQMIKQIMTFPSFVCPAPLQTITVSLSDMHCVIRISIHLVNSGDKR